MTTALRLCMFGLLLFLMAGTPSAQPASPAGTWKQVAGSSLLASGKIYQFKGRYLQAVIGGNTGINNILAASGAAFDATRMELVLLAGGGDSDYGGNEVYRVRLKLLDMKGPNPWDMPIRPTLNLLVTVSALIYGTADTDVGATVPQGTTRILDSISPTYLGPIRVENLSQFSPTGAIFLSGGSLNESELARYDSLDLAGGTVRLTARAVQQTGGVPPAPKAFAAGSAAGATVDQGRFFIYPSVYIDTEGFYGPKGGKFPSSRHTYGAQTFMPTVGPNGTYWLGPGASWPGGFGTSAKQTWHADIVAGRWTLQEQDTMARPSYGVIADWDPATERVIGRSKDGVFVYDPKAKPGSRYSYPFSREPDAGDQKIAGALWDVRRKAFIAFGTHGALDSASPGLRRYSFLNDPNPGGGKVAQELVLSGPGSPKALLASGLFGSKFDLLLYHGITHDTKRDHYLWWIGQNRISRINPETGYCELLISGGDNPGAEPQGTFNKFRYVEASDVAVLLKTVSDDLFIWSPGGDAGPTLAPAPQPR